MDNIIAIIPARSGSKGVKDKNIKEINGKPLMAYTIEAAIKSKIFKDVIVSTDSVEYKKIAESYGASVPFLRSAELATDLTTTIDVVEDLLNKMHEIGKDYKALMILQPTSPLRDENHIIEAVKLFKDKNACSVVSMCECEHSPLLTKQLDEKKSLDGFLNNLCKHRRQDFNKFYRINGAIYLLNVDYFLKYKNFYKEKSYAFIMDKNKSIDIDDIDDFIYAEFLIKKYFK
ncbi:cytidylyltransferase domain-containing protein [Clostridium butyricum]|uniref:N-acylneuraminate cytidylyltransferase n=1 Tax=Clostridium butyricum E4 str. BoNT E BL5262 TaxID=632245 RepID=C4IDN7_CLOBU|nr:acylneuraminate cytidylyltransferase family protein [Clostridium butyricum]APF24885.1 cytidylyltransferase family protein [Clostridium butyricum]EDT75334.1 N-acylneuraminate cytidylyltransferase [Clostridium butyricum 5521]EEP55115.1 N-acylneuraminate cytidylyltransferase [Clostridium butyricum E4 str. BoNT E BL5262]NFL31545.1 acylneuraminate cytidylyltransferase family protein [Clostridium butyricum]NFS18187.1 acylneuraminate cytidylyltransferase family protein [Clostridium butyricum]